MFRAKFLLCCFLLVLAGCSGATEDQNLGEPTAQQTEDTLATAASDAASEAVESSPVSAQKADAEKAPEATPQASSSQQRNAARQSQAKASAPPPAPPAAPPAPPAATLATPPPAAPAATPQTVAPSAPRQPVLAALPAGTQLDIRLTEAIDSGVNKTGDFFQAILDKDIQVDGKLLAPRGSVVTGEIVNVESAGRVEGRAKMSLTLTELKIQDAVYPIRTNTLAFEAQSEVKKDATKIGIGAGIGAAIGAIAGGGKGAAIGAAAGGGAGAATVLATKGKELKFPTEHQFSFNLENDVQVPVR